MGSAGAGSPWRYQTLRAVVEWSYGLLDEPERRLFDRLAVFAGGFTLEAAEAVGGNGGGDDWPVAAGLARLVNASLVATGGVAPVRYRMLETLRAYGWDRLAESGEIERIRDRHAAQVLSMVESAREALHGPQQPLWLDRLALEHGNIRAALEWSIDRGAATAVRLAIPVVGSTRALP